MIRALALTLMLAVPAQAAPLRQYTMTVDGIARTFLLKTPRVMPSNVPVVFAFHPLGSSGYQMVGITKLDAAADQDRFIAVFPNNTGEVWNFGPSSGESVNDVAFVQAIRDWLKSKWRTGKAYAVGMSGGGLMTLRLACEMKLDGYASVVAQQHTDLPCNPGFIPGVMLFFAGTADPYMPFSGGIAGDPYGDNWTIPVLSSWDTLTFWAERARCGPTVISQSLPNSTKDGTSVTVDEFRVSCQGVTRYVIQGGGHTWPGQTTPPLQGQRISYDVDATDAALRAFGLR